jgi:hypothetical protein
MSPSTADSSALAFLRSSTNETVILVVDAAAEIRAPCSEVAVMPCLTTTFPGFGAVVAAPAGATAESMTMDPAVPAAISAPAPSRLDQIAGFKVILPLKLLGGTLPSNPWPSDYFADFATALLNR